MRRGGPLTGSATTLPRARGDGGRAIAHECSFCLLVDARRPDLACAWYAVMKCLKPVELRTKLRISTWQEVARAVPSSVRTFLAAKYGINSE